MKPLTRARTIKAVRIIEAARGRLHSGTFFQNKRKAHRDLKWDYLPEAVAKGMASRLRRAGIDHKFSRVEHHHGGHWHQVRLVVPLDFSLLEVRGPRRLDPKERAKRLAQLQRWRKQIAEIDRLVDNLELPKHARRLSAAIRALKGK